jgi:hypothetical protein
VLADLGLKLSPVSTERWASALVGAVTARSREQVARAVDRSLRAPETVASAADPDGQPPASRSSVAGSATAPK